VLEAGNGPETVVLSHSYLVDHRRFADEIDVLSARYRVVAFDHRDHDASGRAATGYDLDARAAGISAGHGHGTPRPRRAACMIAACQSPWRWDRRGCQ
jgi:hypothetical protein